MRGRRAFSCFPARSLRGGSAPIGPLRRQRCRKLDAEQAFASTLTEPAKSDSEAQSITPKCRSKHTQTLTPTAVWDALQGSGPEGQNVPRERTKEQHLISQAALFFVVFFFSFCVQSLQPNELGLRRIVGRRPTDSYL